MAANICLKIEGCKGDSKIDGHEDEIDVQSASFGVSNPSSVAYGGGAGIAKCNVHDLSISKRCDAASNDLMLKTCTGEHYSMATLVFLRAGGDDNTQVPYLQYEMTEPFVSNWNQGGGGDQFASEQVSFGFTKVKVSYWPQNENGSQGDVKEVTFNILTNKKE